MRVLVCGSRNYPWGSAISNVLDDLNPDSVIHGCCPTGADLMAAQWAKLRGVRIERFPANWKKHGKAAGPIRNQEMVDTRPDLVLACGSGRGTNDCVRRAEKAGITVRRI